MSKYRKKPVVIEAVRLIPETVLEMKALVGEYIPVRVGFDKKLFMLINTLEGEMKVEHGDYVIKGVFGELYPCKPEIFQETYEALEG